MFTRQVVHRYEDPVDLVWIGAAADLELKVHRSADAFAAYDGKGTLTIAVAEEFDADDCLAQMIFHEICHWLVAGREARYLEDWGLSNIDDSDLVYEYAAHRLQAALSHPYGLRGLMAVTTDWRPYWDALPEDPLRDGDDPAIAIAQSGAHLARLKPFGPVLKKALEATATIADAVRGSAQPTVLWELTRPRHRLGGLVAQEEGLRCGDCAWAAQGGSGLFCRQHQSSEEPTPTVGSGEQACERWERKLSIDDCGWCGACCRQGFDLVTVSADDPFSKLHPQLVQLRDDGEMFLPRPDGACVALQGNGAADLFRCRHYDTRPKNCADFEVAGDACLSARQRVGLSRR